MNDNTEVKGMVRIPYSDVEISGLVYINPREDKISVQSPFYTDDIMNLYIRR